MAADNQKDINLDDWDSLPLDSASDDWDNSPASGDDFNKPAPGDDFNSPAPDDDFNSPAPDDDFNKPAPDDAEANTPATLDNDFGNLLQGESQAVPTPQEDEDFTVVKSEKVELDIEGMFAEDPEDDPTEEMSDPSPIDDDDEPLVVAPPPISKGRTMVARRKLLLITVPVAIGVISLLGLIVKFVFFSPSESAAPVTLIISPDAPPREAISGELALDPLYINFPGAKQETIVELSIIIYFDDSPSLNVINNNMSTVRDIIFRITQSKGREIIANGEMQQLLRQQLQDSINKTLGEGHISYIQIGQIRILQ